MTPLGTKGRLAPALRASCNWWSWLAEDEPEDVLVQPTCVGAVVGAPRTGQRIEDAALEDVEAVSAVLRRGHGRVVIPRVEPAARRWLVRYLTEGTPSLRDVAKVTAPLAKLAAWPRSP